MLHTDSKYVRDGISSWIHGWKRNGWKTADRKPVKNAELWQALDEAARRHKVTWHWVQGPCRPAENERADELARMGMAPFKKKSPFGRRGAEMSAEASRGEWKSQRAAAEVCACYRRWNCQKRRSQSLAAPRKATDLQVARGYCAAPDSSTPGLLSTLSALTTPSSTIIEKRLVRRPMPPR